MNDNDRTASEPRSIGEIIAPMAKKLEDMLARDDGFWEEREVRIAAIDAAEKAQQVRQAAALRNERWLAIPAEYREEFVPSKSKMERAVITAVQKWTPGKDGRGICLSGSTGRGKTRLLVRLLNRLTCTWLYVPATAYANAVRKQYDNDWGIANPAARLLDDAKSVRVLMLDDLGQESATESVSEALMDLIEHRTIRRRPILWTTNRSGPDLQRHYKDRGAPIVRRLAEFSWQPSQPQ